MRPDDDFDTLLSTIEQHRKDWLSYAPAVHVAVSARSESLTIRMTKQESEALERAAQTLGIGKSSLVRIFLRQYRGLRA